MSVRFPLLRLPAPRAAWLLALVLPVFAWAPLLYPGYFQVHSGFLPVFNLNDLTARGGDLGWLPQVGQGYDLLRGEGPFPYWLAALVRLVGFPPVYAIKLVFGLSLISGSLGICAWLRPRFGGWAALVGSAVYTLAPFALATIYVRGAYAEAMLLGLVPWVLLGTDVAAAGRRSGVFILALTLAGAFLTQPGLSLWLLVIVLVYLLTAWHPARRLGLLGLSAGLGLSLVWLVPTLLLKGPGGPSSATFAVHGVYPHQLLGPWGSGPSIPGPYDELTFNLGLMAYGLAVAGLVLRGASIGRQGDSVPGARPSRAPVFPAAVFGILLLLSTTLAGPLWRVLPFFNASLTYPWQLLLLALPWIAWLAAGGAQTLLALGVEQTRPHTIPLAAGALALVLLPTYADLRPVTTRVTPGTAPLAVYGANEILLLTAAPDGALRPGSEVALEVRWQALHPLERDYTVFFHVVGPDGQRYAQQDTVPVGGERPTTGWRPGEIITDRYVVTLPPAAPAGPYQLWLGLYDLQTGERLPAGGDDKYVLPVTVAGG